MCKNILSSDSFRPFGCGSFNRMVRQAMENLSFAGVSREVSFSPNQHSTHSLTTTITQIERRESGLGNEATSRHARNVHLCSLDSRLIQVSDNHMIKSYKTLS